MSVPDVNINTDMSSKKMLIAGGVFVVIVAVALLLYFFVFKKSSTTSTTSTTSTGCMSDQDCKNGDICINKMCIVPAHVIQSGCTRSEECIGQNMECKNQKCVAKPTPTPSPPPSPSPPPPPPPPTQTTGGNNGSVSCSAYCGKNWNGELPDGWNGAKCISTLPGVGCDNTSSIPIACVCQQTGTGWDTGYHCSTDSNCKSGACALITGDSQKQCCQFYKYKDTNTGNIICSSNKLCTSNSDCLHGCGRVPGNPTKQCCQNGVYNTNGVPVCA